MFRARSLDHEWPLPAPTSSNLARSMPFRAPRHGMRNMTGLYAGREKETLLNNFKLTDSTGRGRGMPSRRIKTATERNRYRKVELLRAREGKRGFTGTPHKSYQLEPNPPSRIMDTFPHSDQEPFTFQDLTRETKRNFTSANNTGCNHLEYLKPSGIRTKSGKGMRTSDDPLQLMVAREITLIKKKKSNGSLEGGSSGLLPSIKQEQQERTKKVINALQPSGFFVKSYINPHRADILATFPDPRAKAVTVLGIMYRNQVPSPYFFKTYNAPVAPHPHTKSIEMLSEGRGTSMRVVNSFRKHSISGLITTGEAVSIVSNSPRTDSIADTVIDTVKDDTTDTIQDTVTVIKEQSGKESLDTVCISLPEARPEISEPPTTPSPASDSIERTDPRTTPVPQPASNERLSADTHEFTLITAKRSTAGTSLLQQSPKKSRRSIKTGLAQKTDSVERYSKESFETVAAVAPKSDGTITGQQSPTITALVLYTKRPFELFAAALTDTTAQTVEKTESNEPIATEAVEIPTKPEHKSNESVEMMERGNTSAGKKLEKQASGNEIIIGLENESGEVTPVDIDDNDDQLGEEAVAENGSLRRKVSITGRILKSRNSEEQVAHLHQEAENRKKHLSELLDEHAQIVHEVEVAIETEATSEIMDNKENSVIAVTSGASEL